MSKEQILDALNLLDDDMIEAVDALRDKTKRKIPWIKYMSLVACMCVVILGAYALKQIEFFRDNSMTEDEASRIEINSTENILDGIDAVDEDKDMTDSSEVGEDNISVNPLPESEFVGEVPSVLVRIDAWTVDGFAGTVEGIADTKIFEVGAQIRVVFKDNAPDSEDFPTGSIVRVQFTVDFNGEVDGSTTGNIDEYVIYAELIAPADTEK